MGKQWKQCQTLFLGGSKITADGYCSYEIKRRLLLGRKVMTNLDSIFKSRDITLQTKVRLVKAKVFPVAMYGCESWTVKKAERWRIDAFKLWCWRRLLRVSWTARRSDQFILKEINPGISLEAMMLRLKLQYFVCLMWRVDSLEKILMLGGIGGRRRSGRQRIRWLDGITDSMVMSWVNSGRWWWTGRPGVLRFMGSQRVAQDWATELNWTELKRMKVGVGARHKCLCHTHSSHFSVNIYTTAWNVNSIPLQEYPLVSDNILFSNCRSRCSMSAKKFSTWVSFQDSHISSQLFPLIQEKKNDLVLKRL